MVHIVALEGQVPLHHHGRVIWILAGEASGDVIGARLMQALHRRDPMLVFAGVGGGRMEALGLRSLFPMEDLSVMGLLEILPRLRHLSQRLLEAEIDIELRRPDLVITIDSPGFALRLLKRISHLNVRRLHYVAPQVWAWREKRLRHYHGLWHRLLCLLPFEPNWFAQRGFEARFVGHPVLQAGVAHGNGQRFRLRHDIAGDAPILILMPGSRYSEIPRLMPIFKKVILILRKKFPSLCPVIPVIPLAAPIVKQVVRHWQIQPRIVTDIQDKHDAFAAAQCAITKSGTSTLELAMGHVPMVVTYRVNPISAYFARRMITVPYVAMVNLLVGQEIVPELLQKDCNPKRLAYELEKLFTDPELVEKQIRHFGEIMKMLSPDSEKTPADIAAEEVFDLLETPLSELKSD